MIRVGMILNFICDLFLVYDSAVLLLEEGLFFNCVMLAVISSAYVNKWLINVMAYMILTMIIQIHLSLSGHCRFDGTSLGAYISQFSPGLFGLGKGATDAIIVLRSGIIEKAVKRKSAKLWILFVG